MTVKRTLLRNALISAALILIITAPAAANCGVCGVGAKQEHTHKHPSISAGTGLSALQDPQAAGAEAARLAKKALHPHMSPGIVLVFDNIGKQEADKKKLLEGVGSVFSNFIIYGCSSYAPLTQQGNKGTVGVLALAGNIRADVASADLEGGYEQCGKKIASALKDNLEKRNPKGRLMLLFGSCHVPKNDELVKGVTGVLGEKFPIVGAAAAGGEFVYAAGEIKKNSNLAVLLTGDFECGFSTKKDNSPEGLITSAKDAAKEAIGKKKDKTALMFAFDCGGRRGKMKENLPKELEAMKTIAGNIPIFGFYGSGEIGPKDNKSPSKGVGYHVAICAISAK